MKQVSKATLIKELDGAIYYALNADECRVVCEWLKENERLHKELAELRNLSREKAQRLFDELLGWGEEEHS